MCSFPDGDDYIGFGQSFNDGAGLVTNVGNITVDFDTPQAWIGVDHPGFFQFKLYSSGALIYTSNIFQGIGSGYFAGLISTQLFDRAVLIDPAGGPAVDDLRFGPPIPAPGALALLGIGALLMRRRTRR